MIERRYIDLEYRTDAGEVSGVAVRYGDTARIPLPGGVFNERITPGAFGDIGGADVILNVQHDRAKPLARTGGGGLELTDTREALNLRAMLPDTTDGRDARALLSRRVLRGLSVEMKVEADNIEKSTRTREITRAVLRGVGLVDRPAYGESGAILARFETLPGGDDVEDRARGLSLTYSYGFTETIADTGRVRKQRIMPGAFRNSIEDVQQEITLSIGRNPQAAIGSKLAGTLDLKDTAKGLTATVRKPPETSDYSDYQKRIASGMEPGVLPLFREVDGGYNDAPEPGNPDVDIREHKQAKLYGLALVVRQPKGAQSAVDLKRGALLWL